LGTTVNRPALAFKSVGLSRKWVSVIGPAKKVVAFSPFITNCAAIDALSKKGAACKLYTVVTPEQFTSGGSKVRCLRKLFDAKVEIYHLDKLHAKLVLVDDKQFVTIGSQKMTSGGTRNREATVVFSGVNADREVVLPRSWCRWMSHSGKPYVRPLTSCSEREPSRAQSRTVHKPIALSASAG
jgi:hypothetical protein